MTIRMGLVGYSNGGRLFHAPYIVASDACELVGVATNSAARRAQLAQDLPDVVAVTSLTDLAALGIDAVTISTPPETRRDLVLEAIGLGLHVVADKPFAPTAAGARELTEAARAAGVTLNVFHNRRFDPDIVTARRVIDDGLVGDVRELDLRCDQDDAATLEQGETGGLLRDLGSHVVDQALTLLGPAGSVIAYLDTADLPGGPTVCSFSLHLRHQNGSHSHISSSKLNFLNDRELRLLGTEGSYVSNYSDVQFNAIISGERPATSDSWGIEDPERWGTLWRADGATIIPSERGDYTAFYDAFGEAIISGSAGPAPAEYGTSVLRVLDAAYESAASGQPVLVQHPPG